MLSQDLPQWMMPGFKKEFAFKKRFVIIMLPIFAGIRKHLLAGCPQTNADCNLLPNRLLGG
jgi:hypothetical protein